MKRKRTSKKKVFLWSFIVLFLLGAGIVSGYGAYLTDKAKQATTSSQLELKRGDMSKKRDEIVDPYQDNISILFLGVDDSEKRDYDSNARSDAMVLATLNEEEKSIKLVSIPRDSYAYIPQMDKMDKITHAHAYGGVDYAVSTVENLFDVPVDYYVRLNFNAFVETVDTLGGIEFDVPFDMTEKNSDDQHGAIQLEEGQQDITGEEALALARSRQYDSDQARGKRQMEILQSIFDEASDMKSVTKYGSLIDSIGNNMKTNMSFDEMSALHNYVLNRNISFETMQLDGEGTYINDLYYFKVYDDSLASIQNELQTHLDLTQPNDTIDEKNKKDSSYAKKSSSEKEEDKDY
ncbi:MULTISPECIES: LCP family protein [Pontibacillus]|uniref:LCP family protein n=1 Tax=Pontibacillus chungwhensis TaxID=265426 RepID=A0ABY8UXA3_9BACI|nr:MULTISPECIES: LCP family protein [Pontibacillus]MCD5325922.1 LCP family protein [Pontibacillus sp. HN14]WIF97632.1 LCP family protein [Pontibacillus chungwhensis]